MSVTVGMKGRAEVVVSRENTALAVDSGTLSVFSTPHMCALMEKAAWTAIAPGLSQGESSVGVRLDVAHLSATPVGLTVWAQSEVTLVDGKRVELKVAAYDPAGLIGQGVHERVIVTDERFLSKAARKLEGQAHVD
jgi:predicted thioesterase